MKETDIRPTELFAKYLKLSLKDAQVMDRSGFISVNCPACENRSFDEKFSKNEFTYVQCVDCGSVYCSPRPSSEALDKFYENSESGRYWANIFFPAVAEARREQMFRKKAVQTGSLLNNYKELEGFSICDVGAGYGIFLEELKHVFPKAELHAIEPSPKLGTICRDKGISTLVASAKNGTEWHGRFDLVISSEVIEHVFSPTEFVRALYMLTKPGGSVFLTGLGYEGFDILVLQEKSNSVFPPHHINFLSMSGFKVLFERAGFRNIRIWTPGLLDVDIVMESGLAPEFLQVMAKRKGALDGFQAFLADHKLSSHVWIMGVK